MPLRIPHAASITAALASAVRSWLLSSHLREHPQPFFLMISRCSSTQVRFDKPALIVPTRAICSPQPVLYCFKISHTKMYLDLLAMLALATPTLASHEKRQTTNEDPYVVNILAHMINVLTLITSARIASVLATAIPQTLAALAPTNPAAFSSAISSAFSGGQTPGWFASMPTDVQSYILPVLAPSGTQTGVVLTFASAQTATSTSTATPTASRYSTETGTTATPTVTTSTTSAMSSMTAHALSTSTTTISGDATQASAFAAGIIGLIGLLAL